MKKLALALALAPVLLATGAKAQTVSDDVAKTLWCAEAFTVLFESQKAQVPPDQMAEFNAYVDGTKAMEAKAVADYLAGGFTQDQVDKLKTDLVTEVTPVVTTGAKGKFGPDDCNPLLAPFVTLPSSSEAAPADASSAPAPAPSASSAQ